MNVCPDDGWSFTMEVDGTYIPPSSPPTPRVASSPPGAGGGGGAVGALATAQLPAPYPEPTDLVNGFVVGEYRIEKKIGEGGMGAVYSAMHPMIGKRAAIKVISTALGTDPSAVNRFVQEARSVNQIGHPNIVDVFAFGSLPDGRNYFVMEYLQGESLADRMHRVAMPLGEAIEILDQVADALEAAHEKNIVHRDLKPDNVYLAAVRGGRTMVKLLDFGIAKLAVADGPGSGGVQKTRTGMMMGTPGYLSPEQARGKNVDFRTDIYALGCMVFEIVCGRLPFVADNAMDIVLMHMTAPPPRPSEIWPEIPPLLESFISRMLEKDPSVRPSLGDVRAMFSELVTSGLVTLNNGRGVAFGSSMGRMQTGPGMQTAGMLAVGTQPSKHSPQTGPGMPAPGSSPPIAGPALTAPPVEAPKKKGMMIAALAGVVVLGGVAAFFAMKGGDEPKPEPVAAAPTPAPVAAPTPTPTPPEPKTVEPPKAAVVEPVKTPGTIELSISVDKAQVTVDGKRVEVTGRNVKIPVDAGSRVVTVAAPKHETFERTIEVEAGAKVMVEAKLERAKSGSKPTTTATAVKTDAKKPDAAKTTTPTTNAGSGAAKPPVPTKHKDALDDPFAP